MRVHDHVPSTVAFVGIKTEVNEFVPIGTGFGCLWSVKGLGVPYLVTALHVIDDLKPDVTEIRVRFQKEGGGFHKIDLRRESFIRHPDHDPKRRYIDVTACSLPIVTPKDPITWLRPEDFITAADIAGHNFGVGDEVAIMGMLSKHIGKTRNIPMVRIGSIAAMPHEPVPTDRGPMEAYLVEARSIDGLSGSPVALNTGLRPPMPKTAPLGSMKQYYFIGLIHGHYVIKNPIDAVIGDSEFRTTLPYGDMNTGIAIVVPSERITEVLDQPSEVASREAWAKHVLPDTSDSGADLLN